MARKLKSVVAAKRPRKVLDDLARQVGCSLTSIGEVEQLTGVNIQSEEERRELWWKFQHLFRGPGQEVINAVMDYCANLAIHRIQAGELCLVRTCFY